MKKHYTLLFLLLALLAGAQTVFLPNIGTTWHYLYKMRVPNQSVFNNAIIYQKDSIYNLDNIKILKLDRFYTTSNYGEVKRVYIKQRNDSVWFMTDKTNYSWQLLIDYNAVAGQTWTVSVLSAANILTNHTVTVNSVSVSIINSVPLKTMNVSYKVNGFPIPSVYNSIIYERFGDMTFLFNFVNPMAVGTVVDGDYLDSFICYEDNSFGLKQFTEKACDFSDPLSVNKIGADLRILLYPNPFNEQLTMKLPGQLTNVTVKIYNLTGALVKKEEITIKDQEADLSLKEQNNGIYFIQVYDKDQLFATRKIIKE